MKKKCFSTAEEIFQNLSAIGYLFRIQQEKANYIDFLLVNNRCKRIGILCKSDFLFDYVCTLTGFGLFDVSSKFQNFKTKFTFRNNAKTLSNYLGNSLKLIYSSIKILAKMCTMQSVNIKTYIIGICYMKTFINFILKNVSFLILENIIR